MFLLFNKETNEFATATIEVFGADTYDVYSVTDYDSLYGYSLVDGKVVKGEKLSTIADHPEILAEIEATRYQNEREYPPIGDQLDDLFKAGAFSTEMATQIQAAKDANPKPTGV
jgi:hypothetical protein